jgi:hypothetical protein
VLSICRNSVGNTFLMKLVERMPKVWKAVKAKGGYFEKYNVF